MDGWESARRAEMYRCVLSDSGREVRDAQNVNLVRAGVRYFSDELVLGSKQFVESVFQENRSLFGPKRKDGARRMSGVESPMHAMRRLRASESPSESKR